MAEVIYGCRLLVVTVLDPETGLPPETNPVTAYIDTPQQFGVSPQFSEGQRQELRGGDRLIAVVEDDPQLIGVDLSFNDATLNGPAIAIIGGGEWDEAEQKYTAPAIGGVRPAFKADLYVAQFASSSQNYDDLLGYIKFTFNYCKGRIPSFTAQDRNFLVPQFTITCRENNVAGLRVFNWSRVDTLPEPPAGE